MSEDATLLLDAMVRRYESGELEVWQVAERLGWSVPDTLQALDDIGAQRPLHLIRVSPDERRALLARLCHARPLTPRELEERVWRSTIASCRLAGIDARRLLPKPGSDEG